MEEKCLHDGGCTPDEEGETGLTDFRADPERSGQSYPDASQMTGTQGAGIESQISLEENTDVNSSGSALKEEGYDAGPIHHPGRTHILEYGAEHNPFPLLNSPLPRPLQQYLGRQYGQNYGVSGVVPSQGHAMHELIQHGVIPSTTPNSAPMRPLPDGAEPQPYESRTTAPTVGTTPTHPSLPPSFLTQPFQSPYGYPPNGTFPLASGSQPLNTEPTLSHHNVEAWRNLHREYTQQYQPSQFPSPGPPHLGSYRIPVYTPTNYLPPSSHVPSEYQNAPQIANQHDSAQKSRKRGKAQSKKPVKKKYRCGKCTGTFERPSNLRVHDRSHTGERPYACTECTSRFPTQSNLTRHERRLHPEAYAQKHPPATSANARRGAAHPIPPNSIFPAPAPLFSRIDPLTGNRHSAPFNPLAYASQTQCMYHSQTTRGHSSPPPPSDQDDIEDEDDQTDEEGSPESDKTVKET